MTASTLTPWFQPAPHPQVGYHEGFNPNMQQSIRPQPFGGYLDVGEYDPASVFLSGFDDEDCGDLDMIEDEEDAEWRAGDVGANPRRISRRMQRRQNRYGRVQERAARAKQGGRKERRAMRLLGKLEDRQGKDNAKMRQLGAGLGLGADALRGADRGSPTLAAYETNAAQMQARSLEGYRQTVMDMPVGGSQTRIPFEDNGANRSILAVPASAVPQTFTLSLQTPQITYAAFQVTGVDVSIEVAPGENAQGFTPGDLLVTVIANSLSVLGDVNLFYAAQNIDFAAQTNRSAKRTISGLRANPPLQPNNRATLELQFIQEVAHATAFSARISAALVGTRLYDPRAQSDV